jgi:hypothetical protein
LRNSFASSFPLLLSSVDSEAGHIRFNGALSEWRTSDGVRLRHFSYFPQESNCIRNDGNFNRIDYPSSYLSKSATVNPQPASHSSASKEEIKVPPLRSKFWKKYY